MSCCLPEGQPSVRKEVVDLRSFGRRKSGKNILEIFERVDTEALAGLNETQESRCRFASFFRVRKHPVATRYHERFYISLACIVADFYKGKIEVDLKSVPVVESVRNCFSQFALWEHDRLLFVEPLLQEFEFGLCKPLSNILALRFWQVFCHTLDVEKTFDYAHREFGCLRIVLPGVFKITVYVCPAVGSCGTVLNDVVVFVCSIGLQNSSESAEDSIGVKRMLGVGVVEEDVWVSVISAVNPDETQVRFSESFFDDRKFGGIRLNNTTFQDELAHALYDWRNEFGNFSQPATHGRATNWDAQGSENLFLAVEGQVLPEFIRCDFCKQARTSFRLIDRLVWFLSRYNLPAAFLARVFEHDVLDVLEQHFYKLDLAGNIKANNFATLSAARTRELTFSEAMLFLAGVQLVGFCGTSSTKIFFVWYRIQAVLLFVQLVHGLVMDGFAGACQQRRIDFGRLAAEGSAIASAELFFEFGNASKQFSDYVVAVIHVVGCCAPRDIAESATNKFAEQKGAGFPAPFCPSSSFF